MTQYGEALILTHARCKCSAHKLTGRIQAACKYHDSLPLRFDDPHQITSVVLLLGGHRLFGLGLKHTGL